MSVARSSRASTPVSDDEGSLTILTPRSKIKAMLAQFDDDSEDEITARPSRPKTNVTKASVPTEKIATQRENDASTGADEDDEEDEENEPVMKPRGRLAARMAMATSAAPFSHGDGSSEEEEQEEDASNVYQRIRRELLAEKTKQSLPAESAIQKHSREHVESVEEPARDTPSPPRRRFVSRPQQMAQSPASIRSESPGLFMSPGPARQQTVQEHDSNNGSDSDSDLPSAEGMRSRLRELVEKRRRERLADEAEASNESNEGPTAEHALSALFDDEEDAEVDPSTEKRMTEQARPTRKASKKALEEMNRETQRMSRNMQLTHQAKVKKRFTTSDFLSRFKTPLAQVTNAADSSSVAAPESDAEQRDLQDTPPSSPPSIPDEQDKAPVEADAVDASMSPVNSDEDDDDDDLPDMDQLGSSQYVENLQKEKTRDKGKAPMRPHSPKAQAQTKVAEKTSPRKYRIVPAPRPTQSSTQQHAGSDSDSDLEIIKADRVANIFDSVEPSKATESRPIHILRHLAHLHQVDKPRLKKGQRPSMTSQQLEIELKRRARIQAITEREEKLASLRARGIIIMTDEEREREQVVIENMLDKAREDAEKLRKDEKKAAREANGEDGMIASSDESEDGDYAGSDEEGEAIGSGEGEGEDDEEVELSGSEEEAEDEEVDAPMDNLIDAEAGEDEEDADNEHEQMDQDQSPDDLDMIQDEETSQAPKSCRVPRRKRIVEDDDDDETEVEPVKATPVSTNTGNGINDDLAAAFGFGAGPVLGVSQMFAGTMADTQGSMDTTIPDDTMPDPEQDSLAMLRDIPSAPMPTFAPSEDTQDFLDDSYVMDSQTVKDSTQAVQFNYTQLEEAQQTPSLNRMASMSQYGDMDFTPSQDVGLKDKQTPLKLTTKNSASTQDTVLLDVPESPVVQQALRRGRLVRRAAVLSDADDSGSDVVASSAPQSASNAFERMRKAAASAAAKQEPDFNKKASEARKMIEEQAEESEDEYAGIGGASDDEHMDDVADEADKAMIDESEIVVNERELAALYAEKARRDNEAQTSKLYKDLMSGAMRRKRNAGGAFDLDSDEDEQATERRRRRQREEARKRRLLLQDESVGQLGTNEKKEAFLRAIEDRDDDDEEDETDVLDGHNVDDDGAAPPDSQSELQAETSTQPLAETLHNSLKRKADTALPALHPQTSSTAAATKRPALSSRRRKENPLNASRAPRSLQDVRDSVSFLIDDVSAIDPEAHGTIFSDPESDDDTPFVAPRAPASERRTKAVVDRLTLKKLASSSSLASLVSEGSVGSAGGGVDGAGAMAFMAPSLKSLSSFSKAPASLLRRATSNLGDASAMPPPPQRMSREDSGGGVRMGGSKKSSINYQAREAERRIILEKAEVKRREEGRRVVGLRREGSGLTGVFGKGYGFE